MQLVVASISVMRVLPVEETWQSEQNFPPLALLVLALQARGLRQAVVVRSQIDASAVTILCRPAKVETHIAIADYAG